MTDPLKDMKILLPMIRKVMPTVIAQEIVGVQPMGPIVKWERASNYSHLPIPEIGRAHV